MSQLNADNPGESIRSALERVASANIEEKSGNHAVNKSNIDNPMDKALVEKKLPPAPKPIKDEFGSKETKQINFGSNAAEFVSSNQALEGSKANYDLFKKSGADMKALSPAEMASRGDVIDSLGFIENSREEENPFSVASSGVYATNEADAADFYASGEHQNTTEMLDQESLIKSAVDNMDLGQA